MLIVGGSEIASLRGRAAQYRLRGIASICPKLRQFVHELSRDSSHAISCTMRHLAQSRQATWARDLPRDLPRDPAVTHHLTRLLHFVQNCVKLSTRELRARMGSFPSTDTCVAHALFLIVNCYNFMDRFLVRASCCVGGCICCSIIHWRR